MKKCFWLLPPKSFTYPSLTPQPRRLSLDHLCFACNLTPGISRTSQNLNVGSSSGSEPQILGRKMLFVKDCGWNKNFRLSTLHFVVCMPEPEITLIYPHFVAIVFSQSSFLTIG
ncbi:hypothetical protein CSKR_203700 [Clonorchis sinensis]|uniref:Uncharacterized protein n=1 Tax=Clonorchis sinensis TaxID=79923 RepID=A0A8T1MZF3_CLOSI|nr:hypothetical protein CSKR_203700 [Clonorchis sinensis]